MVSVAVLKAAAAVCAVLASTLAVYLYRVLWLVPERLRRQLRAQGIAGPPPSFPYGNLADMRKASAEAKRTSSSSIGVGGGGGSIVHDYRPAVFPFYETWRKQYGPVFTYSVGNMVFLHVSDAAMVRDVCLCVSLELGKSTYNKATHRPLFGDGILKSNGASWSRQRKLIAPHFFPDKVKGMVELMVGSARALVMAWEERVTAAAANGGCEVELKVDDDIRAYSADVISRACFGSSYDKGKEIFAAIRELQKTVSKPNLLAEMLTGGLLHNNRDAWRLNRSVGKLILDTVNATEKEENNLLNAMLRSAAAAAEAGEGDGEGGGGLSKAAAEDFVVDNCKNIYFAGYESTAITAAWCLMLLALHPDWQRRVRGEVLCELPDDGTATLPDSSSLQKMKQLTMVIQETLRLYPAGSVVSRQALPRDGVTLGGVRVPGGVNVYVPVSTVHLDETLWGSRALEFDPARFAAGSGSTAPHMYLPFGAGARSCLGQGFAMAELKVLLALVLARFEVRLSPAYVHSPVLRLVVEPEHGVRLLLTRVRA
ncbi:cytochrome P450 714B1 [Brachypodium distachyon]|nr:cytochrome P450 714B1 [Brachypodium distachyon]|eukprot:XP_003559786.1 cytochrome P450 714B1 [Brachypodium distachyon]